MEKIIIIAGNRQQYNDFIHSFIKAGKNIFLSADSVNHIRGIRAIGIMVVGTACERKDYDQILEEAQYRLFRSKI